MRKLKEIARLRYEAGRSYSEIAAAAGVARSTVQVRLARLSKAGLRWPWPDEIDETTLEADRYERPGQSEAWRATSCSSTTESVHNRRLNSSLVLRAQSWTNPIRRRAAAL